MRTGRTALAVVKANKATADKAAELDTKIEAAEGALAKADTKTANTEVAAQNQNMSKASGIGEDLAALIGHTLFAISVEVGSGLGLWLLFGHGPKAETEPPPVELVPETAMEARARFFREIVCPVVGEHVAGSDMYAAYRKWCAEQQIEPVTPQAFGTTMEQGQERQELVSRLPAGAGLCAAAPHDRQFALKRPWPMRGPVREQIPCAHRPTRAK